jgi:hypothetical protein
VAQKLAVALKAHRDGQAFGDERTTVEQFLGAWLRSVEPSVAPRTWIATKPVAVAADRGPGGALVLLIGTAMAVAGYRMMLAIGRLPTEERVLR